MPASSTTPAPVTSSTTPAPVKKIARRQVKRVNGRLVVVYIDVATGMEITDLTGYSIEPDTSQGTNGGGSTPTPTPTDTPRRGGSGRSIDNGNNGLANPSVGSGNIFADVGKTVDDLGKNIGGFVSGAINVIDMMGGATDGKDALPTSEAGAGFASKHWTAANKAPVTEVTSSIKPGVGPIGGPKVAGTSDTNDKGWVLNTASKDLPPEQRALLDTIAVGSGSGSNYWESDGYDRIVGKGGRITDFSAHPNKVGIRTSAGPSTAAGRYQFTATTWNSVVPQYNKVNPENPITDFSPEAQDKAALFLAQRDYARRTGRDLYADLANPPPQIGQLLKVGLGGSGTNTTWQIFQKKSAEEIGAAFTGNIEKNVQLKQLEEQTVESGLGAGNTLPATAPLNPNNPLAPVPPSLQELMEKFNQLPGVTPAMSQNPRNQDSGFGNPVAPVTPAADPNAGFSGNPRNLDSGFGTPKEAPAMLQYPGQVGRVGMPADVRPSSLGPAPVSTFDQMMSDLVAKAKPDADPVFAKAQTEAYLDTINESLGKPAFNVAYDGNPVAVEKGHPNLKAWLDDGADFTTAAGYGGITYPVWQQYAPKVGATDFSLDNQKKVMLAVATDNYEQKTGRSLISDLLSSNPDALSSTLVNSSNIWKTLPGGPSANTDLATLTSSMASKSQAAMAENKVFPKYEYTPPTPNVGVDPNNPMLNANDPLFVPTAPTQNANFGFANQPASVVNSSGQVMNKSNLDAIRDVGGANYSESGFAGRVNNTLSNAQKAGSASGINTTGAKSTSSGNKSDATSSYTPPSNNATRSPTPAPTSTSRPSAPLATKPASSPLSGIGGAMKPKTASPIQKVTTPTGSSITKAQADAIRKL